MTRPRLSHANPFIRLVSFILCYSLIASLAALPTVPEIAVTSSAATTDRAKGAPAPHRANRTRQRARWREGELLVSFRQDAVASDVDSWLQAIGARRSGRLRGRSGLERIRLETGLDPEAAAAMLRSNASIKFAEPNYLINADQIAPNDPRFSEQWAIRNPGSSGRQLSSDINATQAWGMSRGSQETVIAILDSGIDFTHPDLMDNQWLNSLEQPTPRDHDHNGYPADLHGWDFLTNSNTITDESGHGTAIAGIIAARGNNSTGITGVMWQASLMSLRVLDSTGTGDISRAVEALDYATANGAQVINCSWGTAETSQALREALERAAARGVVVVASAGNESRELEEAARPHYPASFALPNVIAVAATDQEDQLGAFSNWGMPSVTIGAPGVQILTTAPAGEYQVVSGTSFAGAFVAGVAGLIKSERPWLGVERTRELMVGGARWVRGLAQKVRAQGVVSAWGALQAVQRLATDEGL